jgi:hypothetical protein
LSDAIYQSLYSVYTDGPHEVIEFLIYQCGANISTKNLCSTLMVKSYNGGNIVDRTPFFMYLVRQNLINHVNIKIVSKAAIEYGHIAMGEFLKLILIYFI